MQTKADIGEEVGKQGFFDEILHGRPINRNNSLFHTTHKMVYGYYFAPIMCYLSQEIIEMSRWSQLDISEWNSLFFMAENLRVI